MPGKLLDRPDVVPVFEEMGDALQDAGFGPNQLQQSYDDELLLEKFSILARELARVPVISEWQLKAPAVAELNRWAAIERAR